MDFVKKVLIFEDKAVANAEQFEGIPTYLLVRNSFIRVLESNEIYNDEIEYEVGAQLKTVNKILLIFSFFYDLLRVVILPFNRGRRYILFGSAVRLKNKNGQAVNEISEYITNTDPDNFIVFEDFHPKQRVNRVKSKKILSKFSVQVLFSLYSKAFYRKYVKTSREYIQILSMIATECGLESPDARQQEIMALYLARSLASYKFRRSVYTAILRSVRPVEVLKEECSYFGVDNVALVKACRELGIKISEYQHGMITKGHFAYNYSDRFIDSGYVSGFGPESLLLYGDWWASQTNTTAKKYIIGRDSAPAASPVRPIRMNSTVLVLGDGVDTQYTLDFARKLANQLQGSSVVRFRPHPLERNKLKRLDTAGIEISTEPSLDSLLPDIDVLIAEISTGMFDAIGIVPLVLCMRTTKSKVTIPESPFPEFSTVAECAAIIESNRDSGLEMKLDRDAFWASGTAEKLAHYFKIDCI